MTDETLHAIALAAATTVVPDVAHSEKGVYCLMCLQERYGRLWTSMDNGTWYCERHRAVLRGGWTQLETGSDS